MVQNASQKEWRSDLLENGLFHHESGRLVEAKRCYQQIVEMMPDDAEAWHLLGVAEHQAGNHALAIETISRAIGIDANVALYHSNLGSVYQTLKLLDEARRSLRQSLALNPHSADANYNLGVILSESGEQAAAESHFRWALSLRPDFAQAHFNLGILLRRINQLAEAAACFEQVLRLNPDNHTAQFLFASLTNGHIDKAPDQYVASIFDADAEKFDEHLVNRLQYDTPQRLFQLCEPLLQNGGQKKAVLDLGCGTGLAGICFAPYAEYLVGVDLSANMLQKARLRDIYHRLEHAELLSMMQHEQRSYDVILATDVLIYLGSLDSLFFHVKRLLPKGGLFGFSVESLDAIVKTETDADADLDFKLHSSGRFAHAERYIRALAEKFHFHIHQFLPITTRLERQQPVLAWLVLLGVVDEGM